MPPCGDVKRFGPLQSFSAYPFESRLFYLKRLLRSGANPLPQVARRITEVQSANCFKPADRINSTKLSNETKPQDFLLDRSLATFLDNENVKSYSKIQLPTFQLNTSQDNNKWLHTTSGHVVSIKSIIQSANGQICFYGCPVDRRNYFDKPIPSSKLNIYESNCIEGLPKFYHLQEVHSKLVRIEYDGKTSVFVPLVHTIKKK